VPQAIVDGLANFIKTFHGLQVEGIALVRADVENQFISVQEVIDLIRNDKNLFTMRSYLSAYFVIR
jgi:hypothetical protein